MRHKTNAHMQTYRVDCKRQKTTNKEGPSEIVKAIKSKNNSKDKTREKSRRWHLVNFVLFSGKKGSSLNHGCENARKCAECAIYAYLFPSCYQVVLFQARFRYPPRPFWSNDPGGTSLCGLDGYVPLNRVLCPGYRVLTRYNISQFSVLSSLS